MWGRLGSTVLHGNGHQVAAVTKLWINYSTAARAMTTHMPNETTLGVVPMDFCQKHETFANHIQRQSVAVQEAMLQQAPTDLGSRWEPSTGSGSVRACAVCGGGSCYSTLLNCALSVVEYVHEYLTSILASTGQPCEIRSFTRGRSPR